MTKEEIIKEYWGIHYDKVKEHLNEYGMCPISSKIGSYQDLYKSVNKHSFYPNDEAIETKVLFGFFCPASMPDLKHNNGWICIESEEQYDELENGEYEWYNINNGKYDKGDLWTYGIFTHYKIVPIIKSDAPIY